MQPMYYIGEGLAQADRMDPDLEGSRGCDRP